MIGVLGGVLVNILKPFVVNFHNVPPETKAIATQPMTVIAFLMVFQAVQSVMTKGVLRECGDTRFLMVADVLFLWILCSLRLSPLPLFGTCLPIWYTSFSV